MTRGPSSTNVQCIFAAALLCAGAHAVEVDSASLVRQLRFAPYQYDATLPLRTTEKRMPDKLVTQTALRARWRVEYSSIHDARVPAIFSLPTKRQAKAPAVILLAGSGGHKDSDYVRIAADLMATLGYASLSIDAQYHGERSTPGGDGDFHFIQLNANRDAWIQTVVDLRRAVDYLTSRPDIDPDRIGFLGFSQGGMVGGTFIGVEPRIRSACLAIPGAGFVEYARGMAALRYAAMAEVIFPPLGVLRFARQATMYNTVTGATLETNAELCDPIHFVGGFAPRKLLILAATKDELIPRAATLALHNAAREPKQLVWFNSGHVLPPTALVVNCKRFFSETLGSR